MAGALPGLTVFVLVATAAQPLHAAVLALLGLLTVVVGVGAGLWLGVQRTLTRAVPANLYGVCTGLGTPAAPGSPTGSLHCSTPWPDAAATARCSTATCGRGRTPRRSCPTGSGR